MQQNCTELLGIMVTRELRDRIEHEAEKHGLHASSFARSILYREMFPERLVKVELKGENV